MSGGSAENKLSALLCLSIWTLILGAVLVGLFVINIYYLIGGIPLLATSLTLGTIYVFKRCQLPGSKSSCCRCVCFDCLDKSNRCTKCLEDSLCIKRVPGNTGDRRETLERISQVMQGHVRRDAPHVASDSRAVDVPLTQLDIAHEASPTNTWELSFTQPEDTSIHDVSQLGRLDISWSQLDHDESASEMIIQLRCLEQKISRLFEEHSEFTQRLMWRDDLQPHLEDDMRGLQHEFNNVGSWIEQVTKPTEGGLERVRARLSRISRHFNRYRRVDERYNRQSTSSSIAPLSLHDMTDVHSSINYGSDTPQSSISTADYCVPPPYTERDPFPLLGLNSPAASALHTGRQIHRSTHSLAPPLVNIHAPPSYEDATTTQV